MHFSKTLLTLSLAALSAAQAPVQGFNYGATNADGSCRTYADFVRFFNEAKALAGTNGKFAAARLYTSIQCGTTAEPIEAYRAAIDTDVKILAGLWASAGRTIIENELNSMLAAERTLGDAFTSRLIGVSVGSEDLYRSSDQGKQNNAGVGATGDEIRGYVGWLRDWFRGTKLETIPVGHVDTWTAWELNPNVVELLDFVGHNSFPYFETTKPNAIEQAPDNFWSAVQHTEAVAAGKPVWITETGWPTRGPNSGQAIASVDNSKKYWDSVGCALFGQRNVFWYTLKDANTAQTEMSFAVTPLENGNSVFDLTC